MDSVARDVAKQDAKPPENQSKGGAPAGNRNAMTHGLTAIRINLSRLPPGCRYIEAAANRVRCCLEAHIIEARGVVGLYDAALIQSACRWEEHSQLCARWLRLADAKLSHADRLHYSREYARASSERDKCLKALGMGSKDIRSVASVLYGEGRLSTTG